MFSETLAAFSNRAHHAHHTGFAVDAARAVPQEQESFSRSAQER